MRNTIGVLLAALGLGLLAGTVADSLRFGLGASGLLLLVGALAIVIDVGD